LRLQERWGADVNLLLYCCWLGQTGRALDKRSLRAVIAKVSRWQAEVIQPIRQARRVLKNPPDGLPADWAMQLRKRIGALELDLEYLEQRVLADTAQTLPLKIRPWSPRVATAASLTRYLALLGIPTDHADRQVAAILNACCPSADQKRQISCAPRTGE
ncbi:MAG: TIGR02444 family protein, partial [Proteobacteria bacterium]|nr:TIGR02444 family protein [Pseudomonadota bacterium]